MNGLALCAGIGGLEIGIAAAVPSYRTVCYVEREAYAACVLAARMEAGDIPPAPIYSDLRSFDGSLWRGLVDLVSAGYPCQPFSVAGSRAGADDPRHLWPEVYRIIREVRPRLVFLENVPGHLSMGFGDVLRDLAAAGFNAEWGVFSAAEVGAPHLRKRLFCLAMADADSSLRDGRPNEPGGRPKGRAPSGGSGQALADAEIVQRNGSEDNKERSGQCERQIPQSRDSARHARPGGDWWSAEPDVGRVASGVQFRVDRLRALGNAVVPAQAAYAFRALEARVCM